MTEKIRKRQSFVFYKSFHSAFLKFKTDSERLEFIRAICDYAFDGKAPGELSYGPQLAFDAAEPQIAVNHLKYENGCLGGRPPKNKGKRVKMAELNTKNFKTPSDKPNENENVNDISSSIDISIEEEKKEYSLSQKKWLAAFPLSIYPNKKLNAEIDDDVIDIDLLIKKIKESPFLIGAPNFNLKTCLAHYHKIIMDGYAPFKLKTPEEEIFGKDLCDLADIASLFLKEPNADKGELP